MSNIKILTVDQGSGHYELDERQWLNLLEISKSTIVEDVDFWLITFENGYEIRINKNQIYSEDGNRIVYLGDLSIFGVPRAFFDKIKRMNNTLVLRSIEEKGFKIIFSFAPNLKMEDSFNDKSKSFVQVKLTNNELPILAEAFMQSVFPKPRKGQVFLQTFNGGSILYFRKEFLDYLSGQEFLSKIKNENHLRYNKEGFLYIIDKLRRGEVVNLSEFSSLKDYPIFL